MNWESLTAYPKSHMSISMSLIQSLLCIICMYVNVPVIKVIIVDHCMHLLGRMTQEPIGSIVLVLLYIVKAIQDDVCYQ